MTNQIENFLNKKNGSYLVTKEFAQYLIDNHNKNNRPVKTNQVKQLRNAMNTGKWKQNGESITVIEKSDSDDSKKLNIISGQHRLIAASDADTPPKITFFFTNDDSPEMINSIDQGIARNASDNLNFLIDENLKRSHNIIFSQVASMHVRYQNKMSTRGSKTSIHDNYEWISKNIDYCKRFMDSEKIHRSQNKSAIQTFSKSGLLFAGYLIQKEWGFEEAEGFLASLLSGLGINKEYDARKTVKDYLTSMESDKGRGLKDYQRLCFRYGKSFCKTALIVKAFNKYKKGQEYKEVSIAFKSKKKREKLLSLAPFSVVTQSELKKIAKDSIA